MHTLQQYSEAYYRDFLRYGVSKRGSEFVTMVRGYDVSYDIPARFYARPEHAPVVWLGDNQVPDRACDLLHNDFKLNNILLDRDTYAPVAVLDWDQGTRGDGLFDLATLLSYWTEDGDPPAMHAMAQMPTAAPGFPTREAAARRYSELSGRDLSDFRFHRVLGQLKTAVIFAQLYARWRGGGTDDPKYAEFGPLALGLLDVAEEIARGLRF